MTKSLLPTRLLTLVILSLTLGCQTSNNTQADYERQQKQLAYYKVPDIVVDDDATVGPKQINPKTFTFTPKHTANVTAVNLYEIALLGPPRRISLTREQARNELQNEIIAISNSVTSSHLASIMLTEDQYNVWLGIGDLTFDALAVAVNGQGAKSTSAAISAFFGGVRSLVNEEVYQNAFGPAILKAIRVEREKLANTMAQKRRLSISQYGVAAAIADARDFHQRGSFYTGLELVQEKVHRTLSHQMDETEEQAEENLQEQLRAVSYSDTPDVDTVFAYINPVDQENMAAIRNAIAEAVEEDTLAEPLTVDQLIEHEEAALARLAVARRLNRIQKAFAELLTKAKYEPARTLINAADADDASTLQDVLLQGALKEFAYPQSETNQQELRDWLDENGLDDVPLHEFATGKRYLAQRIKAIIQLEIPLPE